MAKETSADRSVQPSERVSRFRRIVTGHDALGNAVFLEDAICQNAFCMGEILISSAQNSGGPKSLRPITVRFTLTHPAILPCPLRPRAMYSVSWKFPRSISMDPCQPHLPTARSPWTMRWS